MGAALPLTAMRRQPSQGIAVDRSNPLALGLTGAFYPQAGGARSGNANLLVGRDGIGFTSPDSSSLWTVASVGPASASSAWTILAILSGSPTNSGSSGTAFYSERPNGTQIVKLGITGSANTPQLVVRDSANALVLLNGFADVRTDNGKSRVIVGTRRGATNHRLYVNGVYDNADGSNTAGGSFGPTNAVVAADPNDSAAYLSGASVPLVLVWNRSLTDAEIAAISANPWQVFRGATFASQIMRAAIASAVASSATTISATTGSESASGRPASVSASTVITANAGGSSWAGQTASVAASTVVGAGTGSDVSTGQGASLVLPTSISLGAGNETAARQAAAISASTSIAAGAGTETSAGQSAAISSGSGIATSSGGSTSAGQAAAVVLPTAISASSGTSISSSPAQQVAATTNVNVGTAINAGVGQSGQVGQATSIDTQPGSSTGGGQGSSLNGEIVIAASVGSAVAAGQVASVENTAAQLPVNPRFLYVARSRIRTYVARSSMNFSPKRAAEREVFTVDFSPLLAPGETILSAAWTIASIDGADAKASAMLEGAASIDGSLVSQLITSGVPGIRYAPTCAAQTSDGQTIVLPEYGAGYLDITL